MIESDIDFPAGLPCPTLDGNQTNHVQPFLRTEMETGRARQRRRFTSVPSISTYSWVFRSNEAAAFEAWFRDSALDGGAWFNIRRPTPLGDTMLVCRFTQMYRGPNSLGADLWRVTAELEAWERPLMPPGWGEFPWFVTGASIFDLAMNREWPLAYPGVAESFLMAETGQVLTLESGTAPPEGAIKISELPIAAPLSGNEYIPVVQSGVTKKSRASDISKSDNTNYAFYYGVSKD